jgi:crotonobetainyl-CoA:carnitine CoA-transferase CaiB-like acyl-CoA transferase
MSAFSDIRIIDLSTGVSGPFCSKLFADFGADVIKIEPPAGDESRRLGPFPDDEDDPEASGIFQYLNTNKRSVTLDVTTPTGLGLLRELISDADIVIESYAPDTMSQMGLGYPEIQNLRNDAILVSVTPFGQTGPWRDYQATDIVQYAASGIGYVNGTPDREPLKEPGNQSQFHAGTCAFLGASTALIYRDISGIGQHVDVSTLEAVTTAFAPQLLASQHTGTSQQRRFPGLPAGLLPCKDGYVALNVRHQPTWAHLWLFFEEPEMADDPRFATPEDRRAKTAELAEIMIPRLQRYTMQELYHGLSPLRINVGMTLNIEQLINDEHMIKRGFLVPIGQPTENDEREIKKMPGAPFKMSGTPWEIKTSAPTLGQHNGEVFQQMLGHSEDDIAQWQDEGII